MASQHSTSDYSSFQTSGSKPAGLTAMPTPVMPSRLGVFGQGPLLNFARLVERLQEWRARYRQRRQLATLDHYMLRDIGLSSADVEQEIHKPFWRI